MKLSEAVALYINLRDQKAKMKAEYEEAIRPLTEKMDKLEMKLLEAFDTLGTTSSRTDAGTAYIATRTSASVADRDVFTTFVRENEEWSLMEVRAAKLAIEQWKDANGGVLPPGINWREERVINVRRSA